MTQPRPQPRATLALAAAFGLLAACDSGPPPAPPEIRPVRVATVERSTGGDVVSLTGTVQAETEVNLAFRIDGRMVERLVNVGDSVRAGQVIARLNRDNEENGLRAARASLVAARGQLTEAANNYWRQSELLRDGWTTRVRYDQAAQARQTAQAAVDAATAQVGIAETRLSYTELVSDVDGRVTQRGAEPGEVVQPGRMIVQVARDEGRDAVFDVPPTLKDQAPANPVIDVVLTTDSAVRAVGRVREVAPRADAVTGTFQVRVGLADPPAGMRLGSTVTGRMTLGSAAGYAIPASALARADRQPAVWVVDPATQTVSLRTVELVRHDPGHVVVGQGLQAGEIIVTAGVQALRPGQKVRLLGASPMIGPNLSEWAIGRRSLVIYFMIVALIAGAVAFVKLGRNEDPAFTFRTMIVSAAWPGATVEETILQVTERLERTLQETPNLDKLRSYTVAGQTTIFVDLRGTTAPSVVPDMWYQVRRRVADMRHTLPAGVIGPFFNDDFGDTFGIIYGFTADGFTQRELRDHVEAARSRLLLVPDVSKVEILGAQDERIFIEFSTERLAGLGLNYGALVAALQAQNLVRPAGIIETGQERLMVRVSGAFENEADILAVNFVIGDRIFRLGDLAEVRRGTADPPQPMFRVNGQPAIGLAVAMRESGDILALGRNITAEMARIRRDLPVGIEPILVADQAVTVDEAIGDFMESLWQAILIIMVASFVALGLRAGSIVALSIPLTLAIVFPLMSLAGIDLQRISLGALIIALTLLVDDAMTTIDAMIRRLAAGDTKEKAATFAYSTLASSMLIGTLVTIAGFVPIGFAQSSAGEYTFSIFAVVGIALIVSWFVAVLFAPLLGLAILKAPKAGTEPPKPGPILRGYAAFLSMAMRAKWITIGFTIAMFVAAILVMPLVPRQFFPSSDRTELLVEVTLPQNASIFGSEEVARRLDAALAADPDVARWSTYVGRGAIRFYLPLNVQLALPFFSQAVVVAKDLPGRERLHRRLEALLAEDFPSAVSRVYPLELGPPVGWPLQYRVNGPDIERVREIAQDVAKIMAEARGSRHVHFDWMEPARQLRVRVDQDQARLLGLSSAQVATALNAAITGTTVTQVRDDIYLIPVIARATAEQRLSLDTLRAIQVPLPGGRTVPLTQLASFDYAQEFPLVWRRDRVPTLTVRADVNPGVLPDTVVAQLQPRIAELNARLEAPYRVDLGGIAEESAYSQASVIAVVPLMLLLMLTLLMFQLGSFRRLGLVLALLPLGIIGVVLALLVFNRPLGFVAILGILSLLGMIAKNAIILIIQIETDREEGKDVWNAVIAAASSRLRPMLLTAISTVLGLIPIAPTVFWGPMAFAIMGGLMVATLLTLVFLPTLYVTVFGGRPPKPETAP